MSADIVGRVLARRIKEELTRSAIDGGPKLVVTNFRDEEVASALAELDGFTLPDANAPVALVADVATEQSVVLPKFLLRSDRSLTWHRNNSPSGLVLFALAEASDRQGLGQLYRMTDRSLLESPYGVEMDPASWLLEEAWNAAGPAGLDAPPDALRVEAALVYEGVSRSDPIALRLWTRYVVAVSRRLRALERAVTVDEVHETLGQVLGVLEMFPHRQLFADARRVERLLERNRHCSAGRDPKGKQLQDGFLEERIEAVQLLGAVDGPDEKAAATLKADMLSFASTLASTARLRIDFAHWALLFDNTVRREGLGTKVRRALEGHAEFSSLFEELEVEGSLDDGDAEAAAVLLDAQTPAGEALADVLPKSVRRRVERMAIPPSRLEADPLQALLRHLVHADDMPADAALRLGIDGAHAKTGEWSLAVFRMLYSRTLLEVVEQSELGDGRTLTLEERLATISWPEVREEEEEEDEGEDADDDPWAPVHLGLWMDGEDTPRYRFRWSPEDRDGFAALVAAVRGSPRLGRRRAGRRRGGTRDADVQPPRRCEAASRRTGALRGASRRVVSASRSGLRLIGKGRDQRRQPSRVRRRVVGNPDSRSRRAHPGEPLVA